MESEHLPTYFGIAVGAAIALLAVDINLAVQTTYVWRFWIFYGLLCAGSAVAYWLWLEIRHDNPLLKVDGAIVEDIYFLGLSAANMRLRIQGTTPIASGTGSPQTHIFAGGGFPASVDTDGAAAPRRPSAYLFVTNEPLRKKSTRMAKNVHVRLEFWNGDDVLLRTLGRWSDLDQREAPETFDRARERDIAPNGNPYKIDIAAQLDEDCCYVMNDQARNGGWRVFPLRPAKVKVRVIVEGSGGTKAVSDWLLERLDAGGISLTRWEAPQDVDEQRLMGVTAVSQHLQNAT